MWISAIGGNSDIGLSANRDIYLKTDNGGSLKGGTTQVTVKQGGNVGIGTTSPVAELQVGSITATAMSQVVGKARIIGTDYTPSSTQMGTLDIASTTRSSSSPFNVNKGPSLTFSQNISGYVDGYEVVLGAIKTISRQAGNTGQEGAMTFLINGGTSTGVVERMRIEENGNVGIGTASPDEVLEVKGIIKSENTGYTNTGIIINQTSHSDAWRLMQFGGGAFSLNLNGYTSGESRFQVGTSGDVVIPAGTLTVSGTGNSSIAGNVGIGTTSPQQKLHVYKSNAPAGIEIQGGLTAITAVGDVHSFIDFGANDSSVTGGIAGRIESVAEYDNGAHNGLAFYTGRQSRTPYLQKAMQIRSTGAISFGSGSTTYGSSGQILKSNGDASPTWVAASTVIGGPYLPLAGGTMTGTGSITMPDNFSLLLGGSIFKIFNDGSNSIIRSQGEPLLIDANDITFRGYSPYNSLMTIKSTGNVGIGTTNPADKLEVEDGNIRIETTTNTDAKLILNPYSSALGTTYQWELVGKNSTNSYNFQIRENGNPYLTIENSVNGNTGNVGIGTHAPTQKLHLVGSQVRLDGNGGGFYKHTLAGGFRAAFYDDGSQTKIFADGDGSNPHMTFDGGNVGIGTTSPTAKLTVATTMASSPTSQLYLDVDGSNTVGGGGEVIFNTSASGGTLTNYNAIVRGQRSSLNDGSSDLLFFTTHNSTSPISAIRMIVKDSGNVGIGATEPSVGLQLGNSTSGQTKTAIFNSEGGAEIGLKIKSRTNRAKLAVSDNDTTAYVVAEGTIASFGRADTAASTNISVLANGNVGIGTTGPASKLEIFDNSSSTDPSTLDSNFLLLTNGDVAEVNETWGIGFNSNNVGTNKLGAYVHAIGNYSSNYNTSLAFGTRGTGAGTNVVERLRIDSAGKVGIGTTNPSTALDVIGVITADGGTSTEWNTSYDNSIISLAVGGTTTKTLTATQQDGGTLTASWTDDNAGGTVTGTGAVNQVAFWNGTNTIDGTNNLYWDSTNNHLGINDTTPSSPLKVTSGTTETSIYTVDIQHTRNNADIATKAVRIDMNLSGADTTTADRINSALFIDIDSSANGDSSNEHRIYGVYSDLRFSGFTDIAKAGYFYAESNYTGAKTNQLIGVQGYAAHDTNSTSGGVSNMYGVYGTSSIQDLGDVDNAFGGYFSVTISTNRGADVGVTKGVEAEITIDKDVTINYGTMIGVSSIIDNNEGTVPNFGTQYLFKGDYQGTKGTNAYGIYVEGDKHYFEGNVGIGTTSPSAKLELVQSVGSVATNIINGGETNFRFSTAVENTNTYTPVFRQGIYYSSTENATIAYCRGGGTTGGFLTFQTNNGNERMRIDTNGNVGIGTTNPIADLHVNGDVQIGSSVAPNSYGALQVNQTSNVDEEGIAILSASAGRSMRIWVDETKSYINSGNGGSGDLILNEGAGKVGIGVTDPDEKLEIDGNIKIGADKWYRMGGDAFQIGVDGASNGMHFHAGNSEKLTILAGGNVGIGTTNPQQLLHIKRDATNPYVRISSGAFTGLDVGQEVSVGNAVFNLRDDKDIRFLINGSDVIRVKNTGNVGIGTTNPSSKLEVNGTLEISPAEPTINLNRSNGSYSWKIVNGAGSGNFPLSTFNIANNAGSPVITALDNGNVGIGTTTPTQKLDVAGNIKGNGEFQIFAGTTDIGQISNSSGALNIQGTSTRDVSIGSDTNPQSLFIEGSNGNVGIGTTSPDQKLHIDGGASHTFIKVKNSGAYNAGIEYVGGTVDVWKTYLDDATNKFHIDEDGTSYLTIINGGNVGIGTDNPAANLDVVGSSKFRGTVNHSWFNYGTGEDTYIRGGKSTSKVYINDSNAADVVIASGGGNVGIGTTSPSDNLTVEGGGITLGGTGRIQGIDTVSASTDAANKAYVDAQVGSADTLQEVTDNGNTTTNSVGIGTTSVTALLNIATPSSTNVKVTKIAGDTTTVYQYATLADAVLEWTCGSYHNAEVVITASQTNSGTYNNLYIRGIWSNNHTSHHWDELEHIGGLTGTTFTITNGQNGSTTNSGKLTLDVDYINGSFATLNIRITDFFGTHAYTIT
jgi:hypothetical protein